MEQSRSNLADMALFVEVARAGSFRHAARRLEMPVSTLSRRISALERRLGSQLLLRTTRTVSLLSSARAYFEQCQRVLEAADQAHAALGAGAQRVDRVRISMPVDLGVDILGPQIAGYAATQPGLRIEFDLSSQARDLFRDPVDLVFRIGRPLDERVIARRIGEIASGLYAAPGLLKRQPAITVPDDLAAAPCIELNTALGRMPWTVGTRQWPSAPGVVCLAANSVALLRVLAEQGHGIALLPQHVGEPALRARRLVRVLASAATPSWPLFALTASRAPPAAVRGLIAHLRELLAGRAAVFNSAR